MHKCRYGTLGDAARLFLRFVFVTCGLSLIVQTGAWAAPFDVTLNVVGADGTAIEDYRWLVEEDTTFPVTPGTSDPESLAVNFHRSYMPVAKKGTTSGSASTVITLPDDTRRYYVSVLPASGYSNSGKQVAGGQSAVTVTVNPLPVPTAQISMFVFEDTYPINNAPDLPQEPGLGGFTVKLADIAGEVSQDTYGNPLGTTYTFDTDGNPVVAQLGTGEIKTLSAADVADPVKNPYGLQVGEALIKYLAPGKYGVTVSPPPGQGWQQTSTIEGTLTSDAWVKSNEPRYFAEFGPAGHHVEFGFLKNFNAIPAPATDQNVGTFNGRIVNMHMSRPPDYRFYPGHPLPNCWVGLNELAGGNGQGLFAAPCDADSNFTIPDVPAGSYQLVMWDTYLDNIFSFLTITIPPEGGTVELGDVPVFRWFAAHDHYVFYDTDGDGKRDADELGMPEQAVNLRFRDGTIYQSFPTDTTGFVPFDEIFPWFNWLIAEVDFARFKATGVTVTVDAGGPVDTSTADAPGYGKLNPQVQADGQPTRTQTEPAPVLLQAFQSFLGTTNVFEWGKQNYGPGENGGISGIVHYATTRAENDPRYAAVETWEPGIPRVQVNLYQNTGSGNAIADVNASGGVELSDVDNYPFGWSEGGAMGAEDVKRNGPDLTNRPDQVFSAGDAIQVVRTDSWDDNLPTECPGDAADPFYNGGKCYDGLRNWNQVRPGVFDGGYAFVSYIPGGASSGNPEAVLPAGAYIVEAVTPPGYEHLKEEDKNVDFGDEYTPSPLLLPPVCAGDGHLVPDYLALYPGVPTAAAGQTLPLCDRKKVVLNDGQNAAANFFLFTEVPIAGHVQGFVLNDLANEFDPLSPNFGEKFAPSWIPISLRDYTGREINRVYTDEYGLYNALVPSTYTVNVPSPSGVSPSMMQVCLNSPGPIPDPANPGQTIIDPYFNRQYTQFCYTFNFQPGMTTYLDTPVLPISSFAGKGNFQLDCEYASGTPMIYSVSSEGNLIGGGPYISTAPGATRTLTIVSLGDVQVPDPFTTREGGVNANLITRDFGFGGTPGQVTIGGVALTDVIWSNGVITGTVPATATTGQLAVTRGDNGKSTVTGVTVTVGGSDVIAVPPGGSIQTAMDSAPDGALILVPPGTYYEMVVMNKPVRLQGWGPGSTAINAVKSPSENLQLWRARVNQMINGATPTAELLPGQPNNNVSPVTGQIEPGTGLLQTEEGAGILVLPREGGFSAAWQPRIDGFTVTGADQSAGILVNGYGHYLEISNNHVVNNQGPYGAGIRVGHPFLAAGGSPVSGANDHVYIHHNKVFENGSLFAPGAGIALYNGSDDYRVIGNYVCGNFSQGDGGGIGHLGLSNNGRIEHNKIVFNQGFEQTAASGGSGGGILVAGLAPPVGAAVQLSAGSGSVAIVGNQIQGNNAGSGDGGAISLRHINGLDVLASPDNATPWYSVNILNNLIVNNVAGLAGGGITMQDAAKVNVINNTIANNDSSATAGAAFTPGNPNASNPQPSGVVSRAHSADLLGAMGTGSGQFFSPYANPILVNNIIVDNRSQHWSVDTGTGLGSLVYDGINDLAVLGTAGTLNPLFCVLTSNNVGYDASNILMPDSVSVFVNPYFNVPPGTGVQPDGTLLEVEITTALQAAPALDEGGNFIDLHYGPLSLNTVPPIDYHVLPGSPAVDHGTSVFLAQFAELEVDVDGDARPTGVTTLSGGTYVNAVDIGADENLPPDADGDGIPDFADNCTQVANADQRDTNGDNYGNLCDGDLNNDGVTNALDYNRLKLMIRLGSGHPSYTLDADFNGNGVVNSQDLNYFKLKLLGNPPGPSCCAP